jgi:hypothetical protein
MLVVKEDKITVTEDEITGDEVTEDETETKQDKGAENKWNPPAAAHLNKASRVATQLWARLNNNNHD